MDEQQKKWLNVLAWGIVIVIVLFRLDMCSRCSTEDKQQDETDTELVEESEADRQAREAAEFSEKKKKMREKGYKAGYNDGFTVGPASYSMDDPRANARTYYTTIWGAPTTAEEKELFDIFTEEYVKAYEEGHNNQ